MVKKFTYEFVKNDFQIHECELLETEYINSSTKMKYKCTCNNLSTVCYNNFKNGNRCKKCSVKKRKHTYEFIKNQFKINNYKLLETEYINNKIKMKFECDNEHISYMSYDNLKSGNKCNNCSPNKKKSFEFIKQYFQDNLCELLETEYVNGRTKMKYKCSQNHIVNTTYNSFMTGRRCNICSNNQKYSFEYINKYYIKNDCKLLETEYINSNTKMKYLCKYGHVRNTTFSSFAAGKRCGFCSKNDAHSFDYVYQYFKDNNLELIDTEYKNCMSKLKYLCINGHQSSISLNSVQNGNGCGFCKNKTEAIILEYLENNYKLITPQAKFDWCKQKRNLPFDFLLNDFQIILEIDGRQHFSQVSNWGPPEFTLKNDIYKSNLAINNDYKIIRIFQEDVYYNKFNWQELLKESIEILNNTDEYIIYLSTSDTLYNKHKFELTKQIIEDKLSKLTL